MEETINKKSILFVFVILIITFLFIYNGLILSGETYKIEINNFRDNTYKTSALKRAKANTKDKAKDTNLETISNIISNLGNLNLELNSLDHQIKNNRFENQALLNELKLVLNITNMTNIENENLTKIFKKFEGLNQKDKSVEKIIETIDLNTNLLRNYSITIKNSTLNQQ